MPVNLTKHLNVDFVNHAAETLHYIVMLVYVWEGLKFTVGGLYAPILPQLRHFCLMYSLHAYFHCSGK